MLKTLDRVLLTIFAIILIAYRTSIWLRSKVSIMIAIGVMAICGIYFLIRVINRLTKKQFYKLVIILCIYLSTIMVIFAFQKSNRYMFLIDFFFIFTTIFIINLYTKKRQYDFWKILSNIINYILIISLFFYLFGDIFKIIHPSSYINLNWGRDFNVANYYGVYFSYQTKMINGIKIARNSSIFLEPALFSFILNFSLIFELWYKEKKSTIIKSLIIVGIITTFSTVGIIFMIILLLIEYILNSNTVGIMKIIKAYCIPIIFIISFILCIKVLDNKINNQYGNKSYTVRMNDIEVGLRTFYDRKILGWGYLNSDEYKSRQSTSTRGDDISGGSNGLMVILYQGGLVLASLYLITLYITFFKMCKYDKKNMVLLMYILVHLISVPIMYTWFLMYFMTDGLVNLIIKYDRDKYI